MAQLFDFKKVAVGPRNLVATVELAPSAPVMTSEDPEATGLVLDLMPALRDHVCLGDAAPTFGEVAHDTELAHLLEHVTVELLAQTDIAGDIACGQTAAVAERAYEITLGCPDDVLVAGALSSAAWILQWAYSGGGDPRPDVSAIVGGLVALVESVSDQVPAEADAGADAVESEPEPEAVTAAGPDPQAELPAEPQAAPEPPVEAAPQPEPPVEPDPEPVVQGDPEPEPVLEPESQAAPDAEPDPGQGPAAWDMDDVPRPHLVR